MPDLATLQSRLNAAEAALHELAIGRRAVKIEFEGGEAVTYTAANREDLQTYVSQLRRELALVTRGATSARLRVRF